MIIEYEDDCMIAQTIKSRPQYRPPALDRMVLQNW